MSKTNNSTKTTPNKKKQFERKTNSDGSENPSYVDLLNEYPVLSSQTYGCYSFVSPEKIIKQKDIFLFEMFQSQAL